MRLKSTTRLFAPLVGVLTLGLVLGPAACGSQSNETTGQSSAAVAVSAAGATIDVVATQSWDGGFNGAVRISNVSFSGPITSFEIVFKLNGGASVQGSGWNGTIAGPDASGNRTATNPSWLGPIAQGQSFDLGFGGSGAFTSSTIVAIKLNGQTIPISSDSTAPTVSLASSASTVTTAGTITLTAAATDNVGVTKVEFYDGTTLLGTAASAPYTLAVPLTSANNGTRSYTARAFDAAGNAGNSTAVSVSVNIDGPTPPGKVDNPFVGARFYINPEWSAKAAAEPGGSRIANQPTAVWLDRIATITGTPEARGLAGHLDEAVRQAGSSPMVVQLVIYDLPGRDCAALASNGELGPTEIGRYEHEYIDAIAAILARPAYRNLRIVNVIEPDSLPNLVTNASGQAGSTPQCATMKQNGNYITGVGYALHALNAVGNVYNYIDVGHHGWLGWDTNFNPAIDVMKQAATSAGATVDDVAGFITNTANTSPLVEPNFKVTDTVNGTTVRQSKWVDWNFYVDELSFATAFRSGLVSRGGFPSNIGMLIDTSRNGWGGSARPTGPGPTTNVDTYVNGARIDRRFHVGNWCNQAGAGLGERPKAAPAAGIDAYVWIKPPGESDGASKEIPNTEGKGFDRMCDPTYTGNARNGNNMSGALPDAPLSGHWFPALFQQLMTNAYPPL